MKTFSIICMSLALPLGGVVGQVRAQNLSGTWVAPDGAEYKIIHNGNQIQSTFKGGPNFPNLTGTNSLTGGPTKFMGTWEGIDVARKGSGNITYTVTGPNEFTSFTQGVIVEGDTSTPISITVRWQRQSGPTEPGPGPAPNPGPAPLPPPLPPGPVPAPELGPQ